MIGSGPPGECAGEHGGSGSPAPGDDADRGPGCRRRFDSSDHPPTQPFRSSRQHGELVDAEVGGLRPGRGGLVVVEDDEDRVCPVGGGGFADVFAEEDERRGLPASGVGRQDGQ